MISRGTIVYFSDSNLKEGEKKRGFGFIESPDFDKNLFFHVKDLFKCKVEDVVEGKECRFFEIEENGKGISAKKVEVL